jgi:hypothetical protein
VDNGNLRDRDAPRQDKEDIATGLNIDAPEAEEPAPSARPDGEEEMETGASEGQAQGKTRCSLCKMSWHKIVCAARGGLSFLWSVLVRLRVPPQVHWTVGALEGSMEGQGGGGGQLAPPHF